MILRNAWKDTDYGGAEEFALNLVSELASQNVDARLISGTGSLVNKAKKISIPFTRGPFSKYQILTKHRFIFIPKYLIDIYLAYFRYIRLFRDLSPELIHATGQQDCIAATKAATKLGIPVIWSDHGELKNSLNKSVLPPWGIPGILIRRQIKNTGTICMVNPADIKLLSSRIAGLSITSISNGVPDLVKPSAPPAYDLVFASRVIREKGIFELINAFKSVQQRKENVTLLIAGEGPSLSIVKTKVEQDKIKNVTFEKYSDRAISKGRVFVLPTYTEAQSLAILKAMMYQVPIISTSIDGNTHFLSHKKNALLVKPQSGSELYKAIDTLLKDSELRKKIAKNARKYYERNHKLDKIVESSYLRIYSNYINKTDKCPRNLTG